MPFEPVARGARTLVLACAIVTAVACGSDQTDERAREAADQAQRSAAEQAIASLESGLAQVKGDAARLEPDQFRQLSEAVAGARQKLEAGDTNGALAAAREQASRAQQLVTAIASKKNALRASWGRLSGTVPAALDALESKLAEVSRSRHLPPGLDRRKLADSKQAATAARNAWSEAQSAFLVGDLASAVEKGTAAQSKLADARERLEPPS